MPLTLNSPSCYDAFENVHTASGIAKSGLHTRALKQGGTHEVADRVGLGVGS
ncbi:MAG TPA: hypothetical protein DEF41_12045 [Desulfovibrio sp.]|uniref:Uncharacterized protein n=1 Tax=Nitratidesulfovibrio vulgaris (strain ATCC 29579 / DSM 644 / CCUG 34227 / NCIMB 8303 / VKM B-1760 / Hildenborough) TaxID=882 RepID=Q72FE7_NITV2|nr:hypothetical protein DVU_0267 [Nitratidesulfovibrio vulgaris str. Hildenborough]HBW16824.1 hypothetical protein [Desulfovibrio sp.]